MLNLQKIYLIAEIYQQFHVTNFACTFEDASILILIIRDMIDLKRIHDNDK